jgi:plasmid stabilization system protein ParE
VRHDPVGVDRVAREAARELVVHATPGHRLGGARHHRERSRVTRAGVLAQQLLEHHRRRELRRGPEAAASLVVLRREVVDRAVEHRRDGVRRQRVERERRTLLRERGSDPARRLEDPGAVLCPGALHRLEQLPERRHPVPRLRGEVGARVERPAVGGDEHRHGPAPASGERLRRAHVDGVDVGPLLAVDLHCDVVRVEVRRELGVLERLVRHDVAPVARGVPDAQQHRDVALTRLGERLGSPLLPVHRIVLVLQQVRRRRACETVRHRISCGTGSWSPTGCGTPSA